MITNTASAFFDLRALTRQSPTSTSTAMRALARYAGPSIQLRIHKQQLWGRQIVANRPGQRTG
jgi:hypothetical protein